MTATNDTAHAITARAYTERMVEKTVLLADISPHPDNPRQNDKIASQADLWYNKYKKYRSRSDADNILRLATSTLLRRLVTMDTVSPHAAHRNFIASLPPDKKYCPGCKQVLDRFADFTANKAQPDGRAPHCKACRSVMHKASYPQEKEVRTERYHQQYPQKKAAYRERHKRWRATGDNWEREKEGKRQKYLGNIAYEKERKTRYRLAYPEVIQANHARRRARKAQNGGSFTPEEWKAMKQFYDYTCLKCGRKEPDIILTVDHVLPLYLGGTSDIENIQPLCKSCNDSKGTRHIDYRMPYE